MAKKAKESLFKKDVSIRNRKASFEYEFLERYHAGICLRGTEVKSVRMGKVNLQDSFCLFIGGELWVRALHISEYNLGNIHNHVEKADRKLLLTKKELANLEKGMKETGLTIVPFHVFINERGKVKIEIALAKGKKLYDKRESLKEKQIKKDMASSKY